MTTISYISAIRYHEPVWGIEHLRKCLNYAYLRDDISRYHGVSYNASDALKFAVMYDHLDYAKFLLSHFVQEALGQALCCPIILLAVQHGCKDMVQLLCSHANEAGITHKGKPYIDSCGCEAMENKKTALHVSSELGNLEITKILLQYGADVNIKDKFGQTPLEKVIQQAMNICDSAQNEPGNRRFHSNSDRPTRFTQPRNRSRSRSPVTRTSSSESEQKSRNFTRSWNLIEMLLSCHASLTKETLEKLSELSRRKFNHLTEKETDIETPFSLMHHSRMAIRNNLGKHGLPVSIQDLGLPYLLEQYVNLESMDLEIHS